MLSKIMRIMSPIIAALMGISACSHNNQNIDSANLGVVSDCIEPTEDVQVTTVNGVVISGLSFNQLGFPTNVVHLGQDNTGLYQGSNGGVMRTCTETYGNNNEGDGKYIYTCFDNGGFKCNILITRL